MKQKLLIIVLCITMLLPMGVSAFSDVPEGAFADAIETLSSLGVIAGFPDGTFRPGEPLTRAQFAKLVVVITGREDAASSKTTEIFTDVPASHWGIGYINEAASLGMITGYPDGSFGPEENITYAQALTIVIRMLGYSQTEVGTNWPADYINKAAELSITEGLTFGNGDIVSRGVAAYILNRSLDVKMGSLASTFLSTADDVVVYATSAVSAAVKTNEVLTTGGTFKRGKLNMENYLGKTVTLRADTDKEIRAITVKEVPQISGILDAAYADKLTLSGGETVSVDANKTVYYKGAPSVWSAISASLLQGSRVDVYDDYLYIEENKLDGPYTITETGEQVYDFIGEAQIAAVTIDGVAAELSDIGRYDIVYFNRKNQRLYAYRERTTGIYEKATPTKDTLRSITVSGVTYTDIDANAKRKLDDTPDAFDTGKRVTLLFGYNGIVADVIADDEAHCYTITEAFKDKVKTAEVGMIDTEDIDSVWYKGALSGYAQVYPQITPGSKAYIYDDYMYVEENKLDGPYTVQGDYTELYSRFGDLSGAVVTIDGKSASLSEVERFDVVYVNEITNRVYVYTERATGIYEKAVPTKDSLTGIVVSGTTYSAISAEAKAKLDDTSGAFAIHDRVTLLFGNDGSVVDVVDEDGKTLYDMGVVLSVSHKVSTEADTLGKTEHYATLMLASGTTVTYKTDKDYTDTEKVQYTGKFVYIRMLSGGIVSLSPASENKLTGSFDRSVLTYAGCDLMQNFVILEQLYSERYDEAIVQKIELSDIRSAALSSSQVLHVEYANGMKDIAVIYVKDVTFDGYSFGILNEAVYPKSNENAMYSYEVRSSSGNFTYSGSAGWTFVKGEAVMVMVKGGKIKAMKSLTEVASGKTIDEYTKTKLKLGGDVYKTDENVTVVYKKTAKADWNVTTLKDLDENVASGDWEVNRITLYADTKTDGKVRVVKVSLK